MAKNRKTVMKGFDYLQIDDFAKYLSQMAAKGWHFKEWGAGLVFERGEPEEAVYCVEVFTEASEYDTYPQPNTLEFAEYCEAAGWKLVDGKGKYCIFRRLRDDAVPIMTDRERIHNTFRAAARKLWYQLALFAILMLMQWGSFLGTGFENRVFSHMQMGILAMVSLILLLHVAHCIWLYGKKHRMLTFCDREKVAFSGFRWIVVYPWLIVFIWLTTLLYMAIPGNATVLLVPVSVIALIMIVSILISKYRPDTNTNVMICVGFGVVTTFVVMVISLIIMVSNWEETENIRVPLNFADVGVEAESVQLSYHHEDSNFLGSTKQFSLFSGDQYLGYEVYSTEHDWIVDRIWNDRAAWAVNDQRQDCTAAWEAEYAFCNGVGDYYVRYDDAILILRLDLNAELSQQQINTIREKLDLR